MSKDIKKPAGETRRYVGIDLGDKKSRVCILDEGGEIGLITKNNAKSDKRDARTLAQLLRADARLLSPIDHRAENLQMDLTVIRMRDNLIATRTRLVTSVRGVVKATGGRLPRGETTSFPQQVRDLIPEPLRPAVAPVLEVIDGLNEAAYEYDCLLEHWAGTRYEESSRLTQVKGVGTLTALTFLLTVGDKERFSRTRDIGPFVGLRPRLGQSGDNEPELRITKAGDGLLRKTLVEWAEDMVGPFGQDSDLRRVGGRLIEGGHGRKGGRQRVVVGSGRGRAGGWV